MKNIRKIGWTGPINSLGYGQASAGYAAGIISESIGNCVTVYPIGEIDNRDPELADTETIVMSLSNLRIESHLRYDRVSVGFWHLQESENIPILTPPGPRIILSTFEVDDFPEPVLEKLREFDAIGIASTWGEKVLKKHLPDNLVFSAPHAYHIDKNHVLLTDRADLLEAEPIKFWRGQLGIGISDDTQILSTIGKFEKRKGHIDLLDTVLDIGKERPIVLIAAWFNPFMKQNYPFFAMHERDLKPILTKNGRFFVYTKNKALIVMLPRVGTRKQLLSVMKYATIYISASYAEGWDFPLFEMMSIGMPCIATMNTAHLDYCTTKNVIPLTSFKTVPAIDDTPFFSGRGTWNELDRQELRESIDLAHQTTWSMLKEMGGRAQSSCNQFTWKESAATILNVVDKIILDKPILG